MLRTGEEMSDLPTTRDELDRKTFDTIEWLLASYDKNCISATQLRTGVDSVFSAISGMVSESIFELVSAASVDVAGAQDCVKRVILGKVETYILKWLVGESSFSISAFKDRVEIKKIEQCCETATEAKNLFNKLADNLINVGGIEI